MSHRCLFDLGEARLPPAVGAKANNLRFLIKKGFRTPVTFVCTWDAYERYRQGDRAVLEHVRSELQRRLDLERRYAVRSSASVEDAFDYSFAGQFQTVLDVAGVEGVLQAMETIWTSTDRQQVTTYLQRTGSQAQDLRMAVIIQEMVPPAVSGVAFSKNPITGLDETIVEAVRGSGTALVQEGVTPQRWVNKWGTWIAQPDLEEIEFGLIEEVVRQTRRIARAYGRPVDLEWVYDGDHLYWVQLREITSLDIPVYSNRISREVFPGLIKPLVWSVNVPLVNGAWVRLFTELIGPNDLDPQELARSFYYRAYFNMGALGQIFELLGLPRETLELLLGIEVEGPEKPSFRPSPRTFSLLPRMLGFAIGKMKFARQVEAFLPSAEQGFQRFHRQPTAHLSEEELLLEIDRLYALAQEAAYYNIVAPLLMHTYNRMLRGQLSRLGVDAEGFDLTSDLEELQQFDPNVHLARLHQQYASLDGQLQARIRGSTYEEFRQLSGIGPLQEGVECFLDQFGHLSDSGNDFSSVPWRENPDVILRMMVSYTPTEAKTTPRVRFAELPIASWRRAILQPLYRQARRFRGYREAVSSLYTFGYGLFRPSFLALGDHFVQRGLIDQREDILYLHFDEVKDIVRDGYDGHQCREVIAQRKQDMAQVRDITPPDVIYGQEPLPLQAPTSNRLRGVPTSRGVVQGPVKVVQGLRDFDKLEDGDVLVIPYSDVGWTPLFARAAAVVAESGGILSHSSIVAREYGIPAVVSVAGACRLDDNTWVTVDGYRGEVILHESSAPVMAPLAEAEAPANHTFAHHQYGKENRVES